MGKVHILCKTGVEWNEIVAVYANESDAETACARHEVSRLASKDVMDRMSSYVIDTREVIGEPHD